MINSNRSFQVALPQVAKNQKRDEVTLSFLENDFHYGFQVNSLVFYKALEERSNLLTRSKYEPVETN